MRSIIKINLIVIVLFFALPVLAQDTPSDDITGENSETADGDNLSAEESPELSSPPEKGSDKELNDDEKREIYRKSLHENKGQGYHSIGMRLRWIFIPKWFITMFGVDVTAKSMPRPLISNVGIGAEYTYRKDNFDITAALWWVGLGWDGGISFKQKNEEPESWEVVTNSLSAILLTADFIWSTPIRDWVAITYGVGLGFGFSIGEIVRNEATVASGGIEGCIGPGNPNDSGCMGDGEFNETYDKIKVVPWINMLIGARFKPHEHVALYVDGGFGMGFQMGVRGGYIF